MGSGIEITLRCDDAGRWSGGVGVPGLTTIQFDGPAGSVVGRINARLQRAGRPFSVRVVPEHGGPEKQAEDDSFDRLAVLHEVLRDWSKAPWAAGLPPANMAVRPLSLADFVKAIESSIPAIRRLTESERRLEAALLDEAAALLTEFSARVLDPAPDAPR